MTAREGKSPIRTLCEIHRLPDEVASALEWQAGLLITFKKEILPESQTPTQRAKAFQQIILLAAQLQGAIENLHFEDRFNLDNEFFGSNEPSFLSALDFVGDARAFDLANITVPAIQDAAKKVQARLGAFGKAGAPELTKRQADFIRCIAQELNHANIKPAMSGPFEELCAAVFEEAGLALPERALRYFMKNIRPELKAKGYCL